MAGHSFLPVGIEKGQPISRLSLCNIFCAYFNNLISTSCSAHNKAPEALSAEEMSAITRFACCAASLSTRRHGGINSIPEEQEVLELMRQG